MEIEINQSCSSPTENEQPHSFTSTSNNDEKELLANGMSNQSPSPLSENCDMSPVADLNNSLDMIIEHLANNDQVLCKSQQRDEEDINKEQKINILYDLFEKSKSNFLSRFGQFLSSEQAKFFEQFQDDPKDGYEVVFHLKNISQMNSKKKRRRHFRNRRYAALKRLEKESYFSETEMMKRNPLLYEQLVGQYLTGKEKRMRDYQSNPKTFVGVLMTGIEKEQTEVKRKKQEEAEDAAMEEEDEETSEDSSSSSSSSTDTEELREPKPSTSKKKQQKKPRQLLWGEFQEAVPKRVRSESKSSTGLISAQERKLLKEEFISIMYQSFLDGEDDEFDYNTVDNNDEYDNIEILEHDEEEKYFDSEEPEDMTMVDDDIAKVKEDSSEDELDMYMNALNQHPAVCQLSEYIKKL